MFGVVAAVAGGADRLRGADARPGVVDVRRVGVPRAAVHRQPLRRPRGRGRRADDGTLRRHRRRAVRRPGRRRALHARRGDREAGHRHGHVRHARLRPRLSLPRSRSTLSRNRASGWCRSRRRWASSSSPWPSTSCAPSIGETPFRLGVAASLLIGAIFLFVEPRTARTRHAPRLRRCILLAGGVAFAIPPRKGAEVQWQKYDAARDVGDRQAGRSSTSSPTWCIPCKELDEKTFSDAARGAGSRPLHAHQGRPDERRRSDGEGADEALRDRRRPDGRLHRLLGTRTAAAAPDRLRERRSSSWRARSR